MPHFQLILIDYLTTRVRAPSSVVIFTPNVRPNISLRERGKIAKALLYVQTLQQCLVYVGVHR